MEHLSQWALLLVPAVKKLIRFPQWTMLKWGHFDFDVLMILAKIDFLYSLLMV